MNKIYQNLVYTRYFTFKINVIIYVTLVTYDPLTAFYLCRTGYILDFQGTALHSGSLVIP